jgi:two-component system alkaline phosphatase synthesis response regulator PhoP
MSQKTILLVDDAETILLMEKMILGKKYQIITAKNGKDAVTKAAKERPDLVLLDIVMPIKDGFEACKELRSREDTKHIPIIMVTTRGEAQSIENGFKSGCSDYVVKPINCVELLTKVRNYLGE